MVWVLFSWTFESSSNAAIQHSLKCKLYIYMCIYIYISVFKQPPVRLGLAIVFIRKADCYQKLWHFTLYTAAKRSWKKMRSYSARVSGKGNNTSPNDENHRLKQSQSCFSSLFWISTWDILRLSLKLQTWSASLPRQAQLSNQSWATPALTMYSGYTWSSLYTMISRKVLFNFSLNSYTSAWSVSVPDSWKHQDWSKLKLVTSKRKDFVGLLWLYPFMPISEHGIIASLKAAFLQPAKQSKVHDNWAFMFSAGSPKPVWIWSLLIIVVDPAQPFMFRHVQLCFA